VLLGDFVLLNGAAEGVPLGVFDGFTLGCALGDKLGIADGALLGFALGEELTVTPGNTPLQNPHEVTQFFPTSEGVLPSSFMQ
jgi:hypothetical protein